MRTPREHAGKLFRQEALTATGAQGRLDWELVLPIALAELAEGAAVLSVAPPRRTRDRRQCFVSGDPDETTTPHTIDTVGADCFLGATDNPHPDHPHTWVDDLTRYAQTLAPDTRAKLLGQNVRRIYRLAPTRR
jgi:hypothetical protein